IAGQRRRFSTVSLSGLLQFALAPPRAREAIPRRQPSVASRERPAQLRQAVASFEAVPRTQQSPTTPPSPIPARAVGGELTHAGGPQPGCPLRPTTASAVGRRVSHRDPVPLASSTTPPQQRDSRAPPPVRQALRAPSRNWRRGARALERPTARTRGRRSDG